MTGQQPEDGSGELQDDHLRIALRHAPDAGLTAPPALGAAILKQASAAVQPPPRRAPQPASPPRWLEFARAAWTAVTRPPVAAALASLMVASTLTLLWRDGLMEEPFDRPPPAAATRSPGSAAPARPPSPGPAAPVTPTQADVAETDSAKAARPSSPVPTPGGAVTEPELTERRAAAPASQTSPAPAAEPGEHRSKAAPSSSTADRAVAPAAAAPTAAAAMTAPAAPAPAAALPPAVPSASASPGPVPAAPARPLSAEAAPAPRALARSAAATAQDRPEERSPAAGMALASSPASVPSQSLLGNLADLSVELQSEPLRWAAQREAGAPQAIGDPVIAWLQALAREVDAPATRREMAVNPASSFLATRGSDSSAEPAINGPSLLLARDGLTQHRFQLAEDRVIWVRSGRSTVVSLSPAAVRRLADALPPRPPPPVPAAPR